MKARAIDDWDGTIWDVVRATDAVTSSAKFLAAITLQQGRVASIKSVCSSTGNFWRYCLESGVVVGPPFPKASLIATFIWHRVIGHKSACKRGAVSYQTIMNDLWALRVWRKVYMKTFRCFIVDTTTDPEVLAALQAAKDLCKHVDNRKMPVDGPTIAAYITARSQGSFWDTMKALMAVCMARSFLRKTALALVPWLHSLQPPVRRSNYQNDLETNPVLFSYDDKFKTKVLICRLIGAFEKNSPLQAKTTRWINDDVMHDLRAASTFFALLTKLQLQPGGYVLRHCNSDRTPLSQAHWNDFLQDFRCFAGMPIGTIGTQSFRRYWAMTLHGAGLDFETIRMLGCWWSDAAKEYLASMKDPRLDALRKVARDLQRPPL